MPGVILYRDCKTRLEGIRRERKEIFDKHSLYVDVHRILESYNFKLTARREILALFSEAARVKPVGAVGAVSGNAGLLAKAFVGISVLSDSPDQGRARAFTAEQ